MREIATLTSTEFLTYLAHNRAKEQIESSLEKWLSNQLPVLGKDQIVAEDITMINYMRKQVFLHFIPYYTADIYYGLELIKEIDLFILESETISTNTYIQLLKNDVQEQLHLNEKIRNTSPGIIYVFDLIDFKQIYSNKKIEHLPGFDNEPWQQQHTPGMQQLIHPEDLPYVKIYLEKFSTASDGEVRSIEYRMQDIDKNFRWLRTYETVFKRNEEGVPVQIIGIALDVDNEKQTGNQLQHREEQLLEAQELAEMGSFEWHLSTDTSKQTPQLEKILELEKNQRFNEFIEKVHLEDRKRVEESLQIAFNETGLYDCEFRYQNKGKEKILWSRGKVTWENGKAARMKGTIMDITERQQLFERLQYSEKLYKQAEALAHIGSYTWELDSQKITWTEELYRIYGLDHKMGEITYEQIASYNHPDDILDVQINIQRAIDKIEPFDFYYRIVSADGKHKILHARGEMMTDPTTGKPYKMLGTTQDVTEKQTLIRNLKHNEQLYKQAQTLALLGNWSWDVNQPFVEWTDELYRIYGLVPQSERMEYKRYLSFTHPDDLDKVNTIIQNCLQDHQPYDFYHRIILTDGTIKTIHSKGEVLLDKTGIPYQLVGTAQDQTAQQAIEQQLRENQHFIQKIADATPSIIGSYNIHTGKYRFVSKGLEQLLGYRQKQVMEQGVSFFADLIHPDDVESIMEKNNKAIERANTSEEEHNVIVEFKYRMRHSNGNYRWFHTFETIFDRNMEGKVDHVLNISIDITERMKAEEKILEQEYFIKHIADASPMILYLFDVKSKNVLYVNKEIDPVLGYLPEEIIALGNRTISDLYHPMDAAKMINRLHEYNDPEHPKSLSQFECRMKHKNGEWRWLLVREIVFKRTVDGKISEVLGAALDITERKEIEEKLFHQTIELKQSNKSLEEYAYVASHDLKEPLRKISTFGDRLFRTHHEALDADGVNYLEKIVSSSKRMQQMINDLLSVSMITGNKEFKIFSLQNILEEVIQTLEYKIEENHAVIQSDHLPAANIVPSQFRQLFQNLLSNSLKFIRTGTIPQINITHKYLREGEVNKYNLTKANSYLQIKFEDNGIGFDKQFAEKIFTIFQRLHNRSEYEGTGIGLAICRRIIENHGGTIIASAEPNKGSIFTIIIPI